MKIEDLKVAFVSVRNAYIKENIAYYDGANGRLVQHLHDKLPNFTLVAYSDDQPKPYYSLPISPSRLIQVPFENTFANGFRRMVSLVRIFRKLNQDHDILIVQLPFKSFLAPFVLTKPTVYHICSNLLTASANPVKYRGWRLWLSTSYAALFHRAILMYTSRKNTRLIAHGSELGGLYGKENSHVVVSTSIYSREVIDERDLRPRNRIFEILFVGRPSLEKGFDTLLDALKILKENNEKFVLNCVGFDADTFVRTWAAKSNEVHTDDINFLGELPFSEKLFAQYQSADVLILPSRSEGTPRVLVEARAFGCPVIATNIGGIPDSIEDGENGLLFEVGDKYGLAEKIGRLMRDECFRRQLRINGLNAVKNKMTLEKFVEPFIESVNQLIINEQ